MEKGSKIELRQKVLLGDADGTFLHPGREFRTVPGPDGTWPRRGVYISPEPGILIHLPPWTFTYIG